MHEAASEAFKVLLLRFVLRFEHCTVNLDPDYLDQIKTSRQNSRKESLHHLVLASNLTGLNVHITQASQIHRRPPGREVY